MLLVIDIGNTNVVPGLFKDSALVSHYRLAQILKKCRTNTACSCLESSSMIIFR